MAAGIIHRSQQGNLNDGEARIDQPRLGLPGGGRECEMTLIGPLAGGRTSRRVAVAGKLYNDRHCIGRFIYVRCVFSCVVGTRTAAVAITDGRMPRVGAGDPGVTPVSQPRPNLLRTPTAKVGVARVGKYIVEVRHWYRSTETSVSDVAPAFRSVRWGRFIWMMSPPSIRTSA